MRAGSQPAPVGEVRPSRWGAWGGVLFSVLFTYALVGPPWPPAGAAPATEWQAHLASQSNRLLLLVATFAATASALSFLAFAAGLRERGVLAPSSPVTWFAYACGVIFAGCIVAAWAAWVTVPAGVQISGEPVPSGDLIRFFNDLGQAFVAIPMPLFGGAFAVALAVHGRRAGALPAWLTRAGVAVGTAQIAGILFFPFLVLPIWVLVLSLWLLVAPTKAGASRPHAPRSWSWVIANTLGFAVGGAVFGAFMRSTGQPYYEVVTSASDAMRIKSVSTSEGMALFGAAVGVAQWVVLRRMPFARPWAPLTVTAWAVMGVIVGALSGLVFGAVSSIGPTRDWPVMLAVAVPATLVFVLPSAIQWLVMHRHVDAERWPLRGLTGLLGGFVAAGIVVRWGLVDLVPWLTPYDFPSAKALVCAGAIIGTTYGIATGPTIGQFLRDANPATTSASMSR